MKIEVAAASFADHELDELFRRRLAAVLARYGDLLSRVHVRAEGPLEVEIVFNSGLRVAVEQAEVGGAEAVVHLVDRVGRTVARHVALR